METCGNAPLDLISIQEWFAGIITKPVDQESRINPIAPSGEPIRTEAEKYILPSHSLLPFERMQIYNQQYWWRLLSCLHDSYPFVVRLFGYYDFNETLAVPYLVKYPPKHWSLNTLGDQFFRWASDEYHFEDRALVLDAISIDDAYFNSFYAPKVGSIVENYRNNPAELLDIRLRLQEHVHFFSMKYDLFSLRDALLKQEPEHWESHDFPVVAKEKEYLFVVYRNGNHHVVWEEIDPTELALLECFINGSSINDALECPKLQEKEHYLHAEKNLCKWIQNWVLKGFF